MKDASQPPATTEAVDGAPRARRTDLMLLVLASAALLVSYVETMLVPALPKLVAFYGHVPYTTIAWVLSIYLLVGVCLTPPLARLGDLVGKRKVLVSVLSVYAAAVAVAPWTPTLASHLGISVANAVYLLIAVRGAQGFGIAMFPLALSMLGEELPAAKVGPAQGIVAAMYAVGASAGIFGGAWVIQSYGWQVAYETVLPPAVLLLVLAFLLLPESRHLARATLDVPGATLLGASLATFLLGLTFGPTWGWTRWTGALAPALPVGTPELLLLSLLLAVAFVAWELKAKQPMIDLTRFKERNVGLSYLGALLVGSAMLTAFVALTVLVETPVAGLGDSLLQFGELSLPTTFGMMVAAPLVGRGVSRFGPRPMVVLGAAIATVGFSLLWWNHGSYLSIVVEAIPVFVGLVAVLVSVTNAIVLSSRHGEAGIQTGMTEMFQNLGASIGPVLVSAILATWTSTYAVPVLTPQGPIEVGVVLPSAFAFSLLFAVGAALGVAMLVVGLLLQPRAPLVLESSETGTARASPGPRAPLDVSVTSAPVVASVLQNMEERGTPRSLPSSVLRGHLRVPSLTGAESSRPRASRRLFRSAPCRTGTGPESFFRAPGEGLARSGRTVPCSDEGAAGENPRRPFSSPGTS